MQRWHSETALMFKRWREEMATHNYDWRCPPTGKDVCHCAAGIGSMRKRTPHGCGNPRCGICHWEKFYMPKARSTHRRNAILFELNNS